MTVLATSLFALGHAFLWIGLVNRLHALGIRRRTIKWLTLLFFACAAILPLVVLGWWIGTGGAAGGLGAATGCYAALCAVIAPVTLLRLVVLRTLQRRPRIVRLYWRHPVELDLPLARPSWPWSPAGRQAAMEDGQAGRHWLARLPLNEILRLDVTRWTIDVPRLDPDLDGLSIAHLSDFHFTGHVGKGYFRAVVRAANELRPDLVALTGDYVDHRQCLDWVTETVGELAARYGVFFVLGNHDVRVDSDGVRRRLGQSGFVDLGGREHQLDVRGAGVLLAGNEAPWFGRPGQGSGRPPGRQECPAHRSPLRIALAHSPDQLAWARRWNADLLLVGHTHGGQICIPPLGPIFSPCLRGVKHCSGIYHLPPTVLHVTRGVSGDIPVRWNCKPEIALLTLRAGAADLEIHRRDAEIISSSASLRLGGEPPNPQIPKSPLTAASPSTRPPT